MDQHIEDLKSGKISMKKFLLLLSVRADYPLLSRRLDTAIDTERCNEEWSFEDGFARGGEFVKNLHTSEEASVLSNQSLEGEQKMGIEMLANHRDLLSKEK